MIRFLSDPVVIFIILCGIVNGVIYATALRCANTLKEELAPRNRKANPKRKEKLSDDDPDEFEDHIQKQSDAMNFWYALYANLTAIFPLLGMFGTVLALFRLSGNMGQSDLAVDQFFSALDTTLAGLIFAIAFKAIDSFVSVKVAANNKEYETLLDRNSKRRRQEGESHEAP